MTGHRAHRTRLASIAAAIAVLAASVTPAVADQFIDEANLAAAATRGTSAAHEEIFPKIAALQEPPIPVGLSRDALRELLLLQPGDAQWPALARWATATPQAEALEALHTIADPDSIFIIGAPYGAEGIDQKFIDAGLYIDLGPDGLLFGSTFHYRERLSWLVALALFESARLADEGEGQQSLSVLNDCFRLGRILAERAFASEVADAFRIMSLVCERMRDVVFTYEDAFDPTILREASDRLDEKDIKITKIPLPPGDRIAASQIVDRTFAERGKARPADLASLMSRAQVGDRPLRLFSAASWWDSLAASHPDWFDTTDKIAAVWSDYTLRWSIDDLNDSLLKRPSDFLKMDGAEYPVVYAAMKDIEALFNLRRHLLVEIGATDNGLGVFAFKLRQKRFPPQISSIDPGYINERARDLFFIDERYVDTVYKDFPYWVPIRDQDFGRREDPHPYEISVLLEPGADPTSASGGGPDLEEFAPPGFTGLGPFMDSLPDWDDPDIDPAQIVEMPTPDNPAVQIKDPSQLRNALIDSMDSAPISTESARLATEWLRELNDAGVTPDTIGDSVTGAWEAMVQSFMGGDTGDISAQQRDIAQQALSETGSLIKRLIDGATGSDSFKQAFTSATSGQQLTPSQVERFLKDAVRGVFSDDVIDDINTQLRNPVVAGIALPAVAAARARAQGLAAQATPAFSTSLDDTVFLLYSVGTNGKDDRAKVVGLPGVGADDILFWPPIIALERQSGR